MSIRQNLNAIYLKLFKNKAAQPIANNLENNSAPTVKPAFDNKAVPREKVNMPVPFLKALNPISDLLGDTEIGQLQVTAANFTPNSVIFNKGTGSDSFVYVVKGTVHLETSNGSSQEIDGGSGNALYPLSVGRLHNTTAIAKTEAMVIYIPQSILMQMPIAPPLENKFGIPDNLKKIPFFNDFYQQILQGNLKTPSFPNVALKLNQAVQQGCGLAEITKIVNLDPVIAAKLIQVVNSPLYRLPQPITSNFNAINRLGLQTTRNLVTAFSMQNLIKCEKPLVKNRLKTNWMQSIKVSSICYILAQLTQKIDPNEALLAGLLHNIGALPILVFADNLPENTYQATDIDLCIEEMQGQIGSIILEKWEFPEGLKNIPLQSKNWFENNSDGLSQIDIVLLAKYHYMLTHSGNTKLPLITTLPAFQKLSNQQLTPVMSLQIIQDSQQQIAEVLKFFMH